MSTRALTFAVLVGVFGIALAAWIVHGQENKQTVVIDDPIASDVPSTSHQSSDSDARLEVGGAIDAQIDARRSASALDAAHRAHEFDARIEGIVRDEAGTPVPEITVCARFADRNAAGSDDPNWKTSTRSAPDGSFELERLPRSSVQVYAKEPELVSSDQFVDLAQPSTLPDRLVINVARAHVVGGTVRWPDGTPAIGLRINIWYPESAVSPVPSMRMSSLTAADGSFRVEHLPPGPYSVVATYEYPAGNRPSTKADNCRYTEFWTTVADGVQPDTHDLQLTLESPTLIRGRVCDEQQVPMPRFRVLAKARFSDQRGYPVSLQHEFRDTDGYFELEGLAPGEWVLSASASHHARSSRVAVTVPMENEQLQLTTSHCATVSGRVVTRDGKPVAYAKVRAATYESPDSKVPMSAWNANADSDGSFRLSRLDLDDVSIWAFHGGWYSVVQRKQLMPNEVRDGVTLTLDPENPRVEDADVRIGRGR